MKTNQKAQKNIASPRTRSLAAWICILWLGVLCAGCQPLLPPEAFGPSAETKHDREPGQVPINAAVAAPVPEIVWTEPPPCEEQTQSQEQQTVCARLLYRAGDELRELSWTEAGIVRATSTLTDVPSGMTSFSPDVTRLVVQTPHGHTAGGPLYLYDLETEQLFNLNDEMGLPSYTGVSALRVAGWHPDGQQLLLVNEDDEVTIWLDLATGEYQPLALGIDIGQMAPPRKFHLAPDGSGFTFETTKRATTDRDAQVTYLYWYDLATNETYLLLSVPSAQGRLAETAIAPDGRKLAYLLHRGSRAQGRSEEVRLLELTADELTGPTAGASDGRLLVAGNLGPTAPVWSPDGEQIALIRRNLDEPLRAGPNQPPPLGDIWTIAAHTGKSTQLTDTAALDRPPVWSPDGRYLAFVTADGQIGMVATTDPGTIWLLDDPSLPPQFIQLAFAPPEQTP